jgi:hypothetical protein
MRDETTAQDDSASGMKAQAPWRVVEVDVLSEHSLSVRFADGTRGEVELQHLIDSEPPGVFESLRNPAVFRQVRLVHGAVTWPGEIDLAPDAIYDDIRRTGRSIPR